MHFRPLIALAVAALAVGGCMRLLTQDERPFSYTIEHDRSGRDAYNASELWMSQAFGSAATMIDVRQPDAGVLVAKGTLAVEVVKVLGARQQWPFVLTLSHGDKSTRMLFTFDDRQQFSQRAADDVLRKTGVLADGLAATLGGSVQSRPAVIEIDR